MDNKPHRTPILWILGIITMVDSLFSAIAYLCWAIAPNSMLKSMDIIKEMNLFSAEQADQILSLYTSISSWQYLLLTVVEIMLFTGAFLMLVKLNKVGFHVYTIGKILEFCVLNFAIGGLAAMNVNGIIMSVLWVLMYATQLRYIQQPDNHNNNFSEQNFPDNTSSYE
ncbi:MAG: hypothetical protein J6X51_02685 [Bacteroidales bacterium]|jgi:hypothetical protein|nr:hypothetical protein [Bacteroidales bacterium]